MTDSAGLRRQWTQDKHGKMNQHDDHDNESEEEDQEEDEQPNLPVKTKEEQKNQLLEESKGPVTAQYNSDDDGGATAGKRIPKVKKIDYSLSSEEGFVSRVKKPNYYDDAKFQFEIVNKEELKISDPKESTKMSQPNPVDIEHHKSDEELAKNIIKHKMIKHQNSNNLSQKESEQVEIRRDSIKKRSKSGDFEAEKYDIQRRIMSEKKNSSILRKRAPVLVPKTQVPVTIVELQQQKNPQPISSQMSE